MSTGSFTQCVKCCRPIPVRMENGASTTGHAARDGKRAMYIVEIVPRVPIRTQHAMLENENLQAHWKSAPRRAALSPKHGFNGSRNPRVMLMQRHALKQLTLCSMGNRRSKYVTSLHAHQYQLETRRVTTLCFQRIGKALLPLLRYHQKTRTY